MGGAGNWLRGGRAQTKKERVGRLPVAGLLSRPRLGTPPRGRSPQDGRDSQTCPHRVSAPTTPVATVYYKVMLALLSRNAIVISPHPAASRCCNDAARKLDAAAHAAGA